MLIVAGYLIVDPDQRSAFLEDAATAVRLARDAQGCLDFSLSADLLNPARINILERWESREDVVAFRGSGPSGEQQAAILDAEVAEYEVADIRSLG
jgi:quinol monooxygenase YgiN